MTCLSAEEVNDLADGRLDPATASEAQAHLDGCPSCRKLVAVVADTGSSATANSDPAVEPAMPIGRGTAIGRYVVSSVLGAGGMGAVYAGYDPELDRAVAIKLLHDRTGEGEACEDRLRQEARNMARLDHPNVVRVYDVGLHGKRTFIAMELVQGRTLRRWLQEAKRSTAEIVDAFVRAGRGLASAHEAGILHGDFKPDNVFISFEGCVVVGDFGLARPLESPEAENVIRGTPAYLAPEALAGLRPSAASDQFSYCVSFWEALHGRRPFDGRTPLQLLAQAREREAQPPSSAEVPRWLRGVLSRGLDPDPAARHPSMAALLGELERTPRQRRRTLAAAAVIGVAAVAAIGFSRSASARCSGAFAELSPSWGPARRASVGAAFHAAGQDAAWAVVDRALSAFAANWIDVHTRSCRATRVEGDQSEDVLERRSRCLTHQREVVAALGDVWLKAPPELLGKAPLALGSLPLPSTCGGNGPLNAEKMAEAPAATAGRVVELRRDVATVSAQLAAGDPGSAVELARRVSRDAKALGYAPLEAEALVALGRSLQQHGELPEAEKTLQDATLAAVAARHEQALAESLVALAGFVSGARARFDEGEVLISRATPVVAHLGDRKLSADLEMTRGLLRLQRGDAAGAQAIFANQLPVLEAVAGRDHPLVGELHHDLFMVAFRQGKNDEARTEAEATVQVIEHALPPEHLKLASALGDVAICDAQLGNLASAKKLFERAIHIAEKNQGPEGSAVGPPLANYAEVLAMEGDLAGAHAADERALRIATAVRGPKHPLTAHLEMTLGDMDWKAGDVPAALDHLGKATARREEQFGRRHVDTAEALALLGRAKIDSGDLRALDLVLEADTIVRELSPNARRRAHTAGLACEALIEADRPGDAAPYCERMAAAAREEWPADDARAIESLCMMTRLDLARGRTTARRPELEAGLAAMEKRDGAWPRSKVEVGFALARALGADPAQRPRSVELTQASLELAQKLGSRKRRIEAMKAFLRTANAAETRTAAR